MNKNILIENLQQLSSKKWREFLNFVTSPYFNTHQGVITLAKYLHQCQPEWHVKKLDRQLIYSKCFPDKTYNFQRLKDLFSKLQKQLRQFISISHFQDHKEWEQSALVEGAFDLDMLVLWRQQNRQFKHSYSSSYQAYNLLEIEKTYILKQGERKKAQEVLENQIKWLEEFFWKERFRLAIEDVSLTKVLNLEIKDKNKILLQQLPAALYQNKPIKRYQMTLRMLQQDYPESKKEFLSLMASIKENDFYGSTDEESYAFYMYALNYCTARINSGDFAYYAFIFEIYQLLDLHGRLIQHNTISQWTFLNIVATACNLKKFEWTGRFIQIYHTYIPKNQRNNALEYNLAVLYFHKNDYEKALEGLQKISFTNPYYALAARILELRVFYEQQEWLVLDALFERFRIYLMRNKIFSKQRKQEGQNFLKLTKNLANLTQQKNRKTLNIEKIKSMLVVIENSQGLMHKSWLKEMAKTLLGDT